MPERDDAEIVRRLRAGETQRSVAGDYDLNPVTVGRIGKRAGLTFPRGVASADARRGLTLRQSERDFQAQVLQLAQFCGWRTYFTWRSIHSPAGFPDLVLARAPELVIAELKTGSGRLTPAQEAWLEELRECTTVSTRLWRPADWTEIQGTLERRAG